MLKKLYKRIIIQLQETCKNKYKITIIVLISISLICFITMLAGSTNGIIRLNKFTFDDSISTLLQRKSVIFTLSGYCIDENCSNPKNNKGKQLN